MSNNIESGTPRRPMTAYEALHGMSPITTDEMRAKTAQLFNHAIAAQIANTLGEILGLDPKKPETHLPAALAVHQTGKIAEMRRALAEITREKGGTLTREDIITAVPLDTVLDIQPRAIREKLLAVLRMIPEIQAQPGTNLN